MAQAHTGVAARESCRFPLTLDRALILLRIIAFLTGAGTTATGVWGVFLANAKHVDGRDDLSEGVVFLGMMGVYYALFGLLIMAAEVRRRFILRILRPFGFLHSWLGRGCFYIYCGTILLVIPWDPAKKYASQAPAIGLLSVGGLEILVSIFVRREHYAMAGSHNDGLRRSFAEAEAAAPAPAKAGARKSRGVGDVVDAGAIRWGEPETANGTPSEDVETGSGSSSGGGGHSHGSSGGSAAAHKSIGGGKGGGKRGGGKADLVVAGSSANVFANPITGATEGSSSSGGGHHHPPAPGTNPFLAGGGGGSHSS